MIITLVPQSRVSTSKAICRIQQLYTRVRTYNPSNGDNFYTTHESGELAPQSGYHAKGVTGYLYPSEGTSQSVPLYRWFHSGLFSNFTFAPSITDAQERTTYERHSWAYYRASICAGLNDDEKSRLIKAYHEPIHHDVSTDMSVMASTSTVGGISTLSLNFSNLLPDDDEFAQTLVHEMMHVAGFTHPKRRDPPDPNPDVPGDNGYYYNSTPLKAELCIAGKQSDAGTIHLMLAPRTTKGHSCPVVD